MLFSARSAAIGAFKSEAVGIDPVFVRISSGRMFADLDEGSGVAFVNEVTSSAGNGVDAQTQLSAASMKLGASIVSAVSIDFTLVSCRDLAAGVKLAV